MKKFLSKFFLILIPLLAGCILFEILLRNIPNNYKVKRYYLDHHADKIETLILGNSHALYGLNPEFLNDKSFNIAGLSQSINFDYYFLKKYEKQFENLKTVILPISYPSLIRRLESGPYSWRIKNYSIYYDWDENLSLRNRTEILSSRFRTHVNRIINYYWKGKTEISINHLGWGTNYKSTFGKDLILTGEVTALQHSLHKNERSFFYENKKTLLEIIKWCKLRNIRIILFTPPAYSSYYQKLNQDQLNQTVTAVTEICASNPNCKYFNLLSDERFTDIDFFDADHLNEIGAKKLSDLFANELLK